MSGRYGLVVVAMALASACAAQQPDTSLEGALANLAQRAGVVFAGEVTAIRHIQNVVEIDFRVDQALKPAAGEYTLREWGGLWAAGQRRYWVGERAVFFLHAASGAGLGSPVDGMDGVLPMGPDGVEVRRLRTRVQREVGQPMDGGPETISLETLKTVVTGQRPTLQVKPVRPRPVVPVMLPAGSKDPGIVRQLDGPL